MYQQRWWAAFNWCHWPGFHLTLWELNPFADDVSNSFFQIQQVPFSTALAFCLWRLARDIPRDSFLNHRKSKGGKAVQLEPWRSCTFNRFHVCCMRADWDRIRQTLVRIRHSIYKKMYSYGTRPRLTKFKHTSISEDFRAIRTFLSPDAYRIWERKKFAGSLWM